ncbi:hypothetical protein FO519_000046 [Halicephalobus sp. NKZ332]|nr:hypothetical protein FO519_000046 [Halicephalobus sp. NKZ332]
MYLSRILRVSARVVKGRPRMIPTDPTKKVLTLTPEAISRLKELLTENPGAKAMKIGVTKSGCNGFAYKLTYADQKERFDEEVEQDGVRVWIDAKALLTVLGSEMDFQRTRLSEEFVFKNPNIKGTCGCGESFNI